MTRLAELRRAADRCRDVGGHALEGIAAAGPSLVLVVAAMRSARTWPMASSAMSSATPTRLISVRAVRRRSCRRKSTPLACCSESAPNV